MFSDDLTDDYCDAWQSDELPVPITVPETVTAPVFYVVVEAEFLYAMAGGEEESPFPFRDSHVVKHYWVPSPDLVHRRSAGATISDMLSGARIPIHKQAVMLPRIAKCAAEIAGAECNSGRRILPMMISISVVYDCSDCDCDNAGLDEFVTAEAAKAAMLEKVRVGDDYCSICLEGFEGGCVGSRMPCRHVFHGDCIVRWLAFGDSCPLCRFHMDP